ncbi:hypothetical protein LWI28_021895 [Acer negundo]|uniref:Retrotransposon gag domain-containing protein n=1 Tax=Acer negundo TaxID=4023 RepID=A0AAD5NKC0_ACENE|nr:hypothetical protein LWI28_021895 [Acer negundo]
MQGRRSLRGPLLPSIDYINQIARENRRELQQCLQQYEGRAPPRCKVSDDEEDYNPFHNEDASSDEANQRQRQRNQPRGRGGDVKVDIPKFDGRSQGDAFLDWLFTVERIFDFNEYLEERKVKLVVIKLKGYASLW